MRSTSPRLLARVVRRAPYLLPVVATVAVTAATLALSACSNGGGGASASQAQAIPPGELVYLRSCARCHGDDRQGGVDEPKLDSVRLASIGTDALQMTIQFGKGRMPAFGGLSQQQIDDLITYLRGN